MTRMLWTDKHLQGFITSWDNLVYPNTCTDKYLCWVIPNWDTLVHLNTWTDPYFCGLMTKTSVGFTTSWDTPVHLIIFQVPGAITNTSMG